MVDRVFGMVHPSAFEPGDDLIFILPVFLFLLRVT